MAPGPHVTSPGSRSLSRRRASRPPARRRARPVTSAVHPRSRSTLSSSFAAVSRCVTVLHALGAATSAGAREGEARRREAALWRSLRRATHPFGTATAPTRKVCSPRACHAANKKRGGVGHSVWSGSHATSRCDRSASWSASPRLSAACSRAAGPVRRKVGRRQGAAAGWAAAGLGRRGLCRREGLRPRARRPRSPSRRWIRARRRSWRW